MESVGRARRVLILVQNLPVPFDRRVWLEATTLAKAGYRVTVICPKAKGFDRSYEVIAGIRIHRYRIPVDAQGPFGFVLEAAWCFIRSGMKILRVVATGGGYDVLHVCNPPDIYWPYAHVGRLFGKKFLFDHHDLSPEMYLAKFERPNRLVHTLLLLLERCTFRAADLVIAVNDSHRRIALDRGGVPSEDLFVVRSGPDLHRLRVYPPDSACRGGKPHQLVYLGEICKQDGVDHLIRALRVLRDELGRDDIHCMIVGGGPHQPEIRSYAAELSVADMCTFTGRVSDDELCRILSSADVAVDPDPKSSWSDQSTMNKVVEYMHFGLPVVGYALTENMVSAGEAGLFAEPNRERDLARCINELLDDPSQRREMGRVGQDRVRKALAWEYSAPVLLAAYERMISTGRVRRSGRGPIRSAAIVLSVVAALFGLAMPAVWSTETAEVLDFGYSPDEIAIPAGGEVVWTNTGGSTHTVTVEDGSADAFDSGPIASGASFSHVFDNVGTFAYHCRIHTSMTAVVKVSPGPTTTMRPSPPQPRPTTTRPETMTRAPETATTSETTTTSEANTTSAATTTSETTTMGLAATSTTRNPAPARSAPAVALRRAAPRPPITTMTVQAPAPTTTPTVTSTTGVPTPVPPLVPSSTTSSTSAPVVPGAALAAEETGPDTTDEQVGVKEREEPSSDAGLRRPTGDGRMATAGAALIVAGGLWSVRVRRNQRR